MKGQKEVQQIEAQRVHAIMALGHIPNPAGIAIDGGAHVGSWAIEMSDYFSDVYAFEPCAESFTMLKDNMAYRRAGSIHLNQKALMDKCCLVSVDPPRPKRRTLTARQVSYGGDVQAVSIDSLELPGCDLIKLDLEGAEYLALQGAAETIRKFNPFLVVEFNGLGSRFGYTDKAINLLLKTWGYKLVWADGVDRGYAWKPQ